jgi:CHAD domain-containing protein
VVLAGLRSQLAGLPPGAGTDAVREQVERKAGAAFDAGYRQVHKALQSERYFRLLDNLEDFRDKPPVRADEVAAGRRLAVKAVDKSVRRLRRSQKAARQARRGTDYENALHQVRKEAKRLRHVAELAVLVKGKRAGEVAKAAHKQQNILGGFHVAVVARKMLQVLEGGPALAEAAAEALAVLRKRQADVMDQSEAKYRKARKKSRGLLRRGVL